MEVGGGRVMTDWYFQHCLVPCRGDEQSLTSLLLKKHNNSGYGMLKRRESFKTKSREINK